MIDLDPRKWALAKKLNGVTAAQMDRTNLAMIGGLLLTGAISYGVFSTAAGAVMTLGVYFVFMLTLGDTLVQPFNEWDIKAKFAYVVLATIAMWGDMYTEIVPEQVVVLGTAVVTAFDCWIVVMLASFWANRNAPPSKPS